MNSERNKNSKNPWNNNAGKRTNSSNSNNPVSTSESKFKEAQLKLQAAVAKYADEYESSSEEEELESESVIDTLLKNYSHFGGKSEHLGRTQAFLEDTLLSGAATCLICICTVKRADKIWSCISCYCFFHLSCIERWSKDSVVHQKESLSEHLQHSNISDNKIKWGCPKCRYEYSADNIPREYRCFCGKILEPPFQPWLVPHSCGSICSKKLQPLCGHDCVLLCHPGPCPPCPKTVSVKCFCGAKPPKIQRCSNKEWSCGSACKKLLSCGKHMCFKPCHRGECPPCTKRSMQKCQCAAEEQLQDCATPNWQCKKICNRPLSCANHKCAEVCHSGSCDDCLLTKSRYCPCGKSSYQLSCLEETPTCGDTCGKLLECGTHTCNQRCHKDKCGTCLELAVKKCRCGLHEKEVQCKKQYLCETKCKRIKDCDRHPCNRKCCDGMCPPCEKPCGRTLTCGLHKCGSVCHRGPCFPCTLTTSVRCRCGSTVVTVPCGRNKRTKPPRCLRSCKIPPDCHHEKRDAHRCHFGDCPPCKQVCLKTLRCTHTCPVVCHSAVLMKIEAQKIASMPWEQTGVQLERKCLPCPDCKVPVAVKCLGGHEISEWPCHAAKITSCHKPCNRLLSCGNHHCQLDCHTVENAPDQVTAGTNCGQCENPCSFPRPEGCQHDCPKPCHAGECPPCKHMFRLKCHCGLNQQYIQCVEWTSSDENKEKLQCCGNQCPKNYDCGHRCKAICHSGPCPNPEQCRKKVKVFCACKRIKKEILCELVRNKSVAVDCDEICEQKKLEEDKLHQIELEEKKKLEQLQNAKELEKFQKKFQGKKKYKDKRRVSVEEQKTFLQKYWMLFIMMFGLMFSFYLLY